MSDNTTKERHKFIAVYWVSYFSESCVLVWSKTSVL